MGKKYTLVIYINLKKKKKMLNTWMNGNRAGNLAYELGFKVLKENN